MGDTKEVIWSFRSEVPINICLLLGLVSLFNGISTFVGLFDAKAILQEEPQGYSHNLEKWVHTFLKGFCRKMNVMKRLESELADNDSAVQCFNNYTTRIPTHTAWQFKHIKKVVKSILTAEPVVIVDMSEVGQFDRKLRLEL